ncbi:MAG: hypothetical protein ABI919_09990 [Ramlibacter sp.]
MSNGKQAPAAAGGHDKASIENTIEKINRQMRTVRAFDVSGAPDGWNSGIDALQKKVNGTLADSLGTGTPEYKQYQLSARDFAVDSTFGDRSSIGERKNKIREGIEKALESLSAARKLLNKRLEEGFADAPGEPGEPGEVAAVTEPEKPVAPAPAPAPVPTPPPPPPPPVKPPVTAPAPAPTPPPPPAPSTATRTPMPKTESASSSAQATGTGVAILGWGGDAAQACEFIDQLGLDAAVLDAISVEKLDSLRTVQFLLLLPGDEAGASDAMLAIGFMLAVLGKSRMACLLTGDEKVPQVLKGTTAITVDDSGLWQLQLAREMKRAGLVVDLNRLL